MATKANITIDQGVDWETDLNCTDENGDIIPLSGITASCQIKRTYESQKYINVDTSINSVTGSISLFLPASITSNIYPGRYVYDVTLYDTSSNGFSRVVEGLCIVTPGVTNINLYFSNTSTSNSVNSTNGEF